MHTYRTGVGEFYSSYIDVSWRTVLSARFPLVDTWGIGGLLLRGLFDQVERA